LKKKGGEKGPFPRGREKRRKKRAKEDPDPELEVRGGRGGKKNVPSLTKAARGKKRGTTEKEARAGEREKLLRKQDFRWDEKRGIRIADLERGTGTEGRISGATTTDKNRVQNCMSRPVQWERVGGGGRVEKVSYEWRGKGARKKPLSVFRRKREEKT